MGVVGMALMLGFFFRISCHLHILPSAFTWLSVHMVETLSQPILIKKKKNGTLRICSGEFVLIIAGNFSSAFFCYG